MKKRLLTYVRLLTGLFLYGLGLVFTINAGVGLSPWDAFHQGLSIRLGITMGQASIIAGLVIVVINFVFREKIGIATILNMICIGLVMDFLMLNHLVPVFSHLLLSYAMLFAGMFIIAFATYFYIGAGLGSGPRDGLMVTIHKRTGKSVRFSRNCIEISVLAAGYLLGGQVGFGTVILSFGIGYVTQFVFKVMKFNIKEVEHQYIDDAVRNLFRRRKES